MKKKDIVSLMASSIGMHQLVRVYCRYDENYWYYYPNAVNARLFLGQEEDDFLLDGYHIRRIADVTKAQIKDDLCERINMCNGVADGVVCPGIDITSWRSVFSSPVLRRRFVIIRNDFSGEYVIGLIQKASARNVRVWSFDADGIFDEEPAVIPYSQITHVAWQTRYVDEWQRYLTANGMIPDFVKTQDVRPALPADVNDCSFPVLPLDKTSAPR